MAAVQDHHAGLSPTQHRYQSVQRRQGLPGGFSANIDAAVANMHHDKTTRTHATLQYYSFTAIIQDNP